MFASLPSSSTTDRRHWLATALAAPGLASLGLLGCASPGASTPAPLLLQPWHMPGVHSVDLPAAPLPGRSAARQHRVLVYIPQGEAPAGGWPVIYVLDGNLMFSPLAQLVHNRSARGAELRGGSAVVVGLGHVLPADSTEVHDRAARTYDYTLPFDGVAPDSQGRAQGGADVFLDWMAQQLLPLLHARLPINPSQQMLVGHSYGGLLTLHALFTRPALFQRYVAASPSLWWGNGLVLDEAVRFLQRQAQQPALAQPVQLYLSQGSEEMAGRNPAQRSATANPERAASAQAAQARAQVHGLHTLADLQQALNAVAGLRCQHDVWPGANHGGTQLFACMQAARVGLWAPD